MTGNRVELDKRAQEILNQNYDAIYRRTDRLFVVLMLFQSVFAVLAALVVSPFTWIGDTNSVHVTVYASIVMGAMISGFPAYLVYTQSGSVFTRHTIAVGQMLTSVLLIHVTGGRIETHFHVFGSLAFLAFYRDWKVMVTATLVISVDHFVRGTYYPQSVFGVLMASPYRWVEHAAWVVFEDIFLFIAIRQSVEEMKNSAQKTRNLESMVHELEKAGHHKNLFIASMSHELRTPLHAIIGYSEILQEEAMEQNLQDKAEDLSRIYRSGNHLLGLVNALLDVSKIDKGLIDLDLRTCCVRKLAEEVLEYTTESIEKNGNRLEVCFEEGIGDMVTDCQKLQQCLIHLLDNAGKFCKGGVVKLEVKSHVEPQFLKFAVSDTGIGMSSQQIERAFQKFVQGDNSLSRQFEGAGVGLYITSEFCRALGGNIEIQSELGCWTRFTIIIPREIQESDIFSD